MIGRYVEADPIGNKNGKNHLYVYVGNSPLNLRDPAGLMPCNGTWKEAGDPDWSFMACVCYWICIPCDDPAMWGGNKRTRVSTKGMTMWDPGKSKYICNCDKPGSDRTCRSKCEDKNFYWRQGDDDNSYWKQGQ